MRLVSIDDLKGTEILAKQVITDDGIVLIEEGTRLRKEYIEHLSQMNIVGVYVLDKNPEELENAVSNQHNVKNYVPDVDNSANSEEHVYTIEETSIKAREIVHDVLERHIYKHNNGLKKIGDTAEMILNAVLSEPEVLDNITEIRNVSTDMYTHCVNVCALSTILALRLRMSERQVKNIAIGAIMHDIGLRYIQVPYINIVENKLNSRDALEYKKHTIYGYSSIQEEDWLPDVAKEIILLHHERNDGSGYPFQQKSDKLKTEVKLVSLCDEFDSLISGIGNKKMKIYEAIEYIRVQSGAKFDATIAKKLLESVAVYPVGLIVYTNEGEKGMVVRQNKDVTDRPVIKMLAHADGTEYKENVEKNLMRMLTLFIVDTE